LKPINLIRNCGVKFRKVCPEKWERLASTASEGVRFCDACTREVFLCETDAEAVAHARAGDCIAKPIPDVSGLPAARVILGRPAVPPKKPTRQERLLLQEAAREAGKTDALRDVEYASRECPGCGYPCADWLKACRVCGRKLRRANRRVTGRLTGGSSGPA
jgi:hypothetical protein